MPSPRTKPSRTSIVAFGMLLVVLYVLSYAPVFRFAGDAGDQFLGFREDWQELYRPVEWLTDSTPLRKPLMNWAALWGDYVEQDFRIRSDLRMQGVEPYPDGRLILRIPLGTELDIPLRPGPNPSDPHSRTVPIEP